MSPRTNRPPKRRCPDCGGDHFAFSVTAICHRCKADTADDRKALREALQEARLARRAR